MTDEVKPEVIKKTQELLGKYFKKPPLTEKLLRKPPFRFLHDIVSAVIRETGFLGGLFTEIELDSANVKEKEDKIAYLIKLIDAVKFITGQNLTVRPSKIVSGQEPTKTNELLQAIAKALDKRISSKEAIEQYKKNAERKSQTTRKSKEESTKKSSKKSLHVKKLSDKEKPPSDDKKVSSTSGKDQVEDIKQEEKITVLQEKENKNKDEQTLDEKKVVDKVSEVNVERKSSSLRSRKQTSDQKSEQDEKSPKTVDSSRHKSTLLDTTNGHKSKDQRPRSSKDSATVRKKKPPKPQKSNSIPENDVDNLISNFSEIDKVKDSQDLITDKIIDSEKTEKPTVVTKQQSLENGTILFNDAVGGYTQNNDVIITNENIRPKTSLRPPSARPISARPAAPRMRAKTDFIINEDVFTPTGNVSVIVENFDTKEDDADDMIVMEAARDSLQINGMDKLNSQLSQEHGHLVAQILETQMELINTDSADVMPKKVEIEWEAGSRRDREAVIKEVDKLRSTIQTLTRATNPLGKLFDFVQEDVETMQKELQEWQRQYEELSEELEMEQTRTEQSIEPMKESLEEITNNIKQQLNKIGQVKLNIIRNDQKIQRLLNGNL